MRQIEFSVRLVLKEARRKLYETEHHLLKERDTVNYTKIAGDSNLKSCLNQLSLESLGLLRYMEMHTYSSSITYEGIQLDPGEFIVHLDFFVKKFGKTKKQIRARLKELERYEIITKIGLVKNVKGTVLSKRARLRARLQHVIYSINTIVYHLSEKSKGHGIGHPYISKYDKQIDLILERFKFFWDRRMELTGSNLRYDITPQVNKHVATSILNKLNQLVPVGVNLAWLDIIMKVYLQMEDSYLRKTNYPLTCLLRRLPNIVEMIMVNEDYMRIITSYSNKVRMASNENEDEVSTDTETFELK